MLKEENWRSLYSFVKKSDFAPFPFTKWSKLHVANAFYFISFQLREKKTSCSCELVQCLNFTWLRMSWTRCKHFLAYEKFDAKCSTFQSDETIEIAVGVRSTVLSLCNHKRVADISTFPLEVLEGEDRLLEVFDKSNSSKREKKWRFKAFKSNVLRINEELNHPENLGYRLTRLWGYKSGQNPIIASQYILLQELLQIWFIGKCMHRISCL